MAIAAQPYQHEFEEVEEEFYPSGDGKPMTETGKHVNRILHSLGVLIYYFADRPEVHVV